MLSHMGSQLVLAISLSTFTVMQCSATRIYDTRSDLAAPPISSSGFTVPLSNGKSVSAPHGITTLTKWCHNSGLGQSLPPVPTTHTLAVLTLARGTLTYSCAGPTTGNGSVPAGGPRHPGYSQSPAVLSSDVATLVDVAPLLPMIHDEDTLHTLPGKVLKFDYSELNTTYHVVGTWGGTDKGGYIRLEEEQKGLDGYVKVRSHIDGGWGAKEWWEGVREGGKWLVYAVKTVGGGQAPGCGTEHLDIDIPYAAEMWFYERLP